MLPADSDEPFDPYDLKPLASINRRVFIDLPGIDPAWVGRTGSDLVTKPGLLRLLEPYAPALGLDAAEREEWPARLEIALHSPELLVRQAAESAAREFGRRLGGLVASILRSPLGLTSPLTAWEAAYLQTWREQALTFVLGGGLASGEMGRRLCLAAQEVLAACGCPERRFEPAAWPSLLPLIGAARTLPAQPGALRVVADFGGSRAKRGIALYGRDGALRELRVLPAKNIATLTHNNDPAGLAAGMVALIAEAVEQTGPGARLDPLVVCSVGAYVQDGLPVRINRGAYTSLHRVSDDLAGWFSRQLRAATGRALRITFLHDCDAAACAYAGRSQTAVLMLGTGSGIGFVPPTGRCLPLSPDFQLTIS